MTINIPLFENYFLLSDSHQFILAKKNEDKMFHTKKLMRCGAELNFVSEFLKFSLEPHDEKWKNKNAICVRDTLFLMPRKRSFTATGVVLSTNKTGFRRGKNSLLFSFGGYF